MMYIWCQGPGNQSELKKSFYCFHSVPEVKEMSSHLMEATILPRDCILGYK